MLDKDLFSYKEGMNIDQHYNILTTSDNRNAKLTYDIIIVFHRWDSSYTGGSLSLS